MPSMSTKTMNATAARICELFPIIFRKLHRQRAMSRVERNVIRDKHQTRRVAVATASGLG